jgi:hypothetical protein
VVFAAFLLPPGLLCLVLALGRYEEWLLREPAPPQSARHARTRTRTRRHLSLVPRTGSQTAVGNESGRRRVADAA